jgi:type IV secretory pathway VirB4 component
MLAYMGVPAHHATTRHLGAAYPFASEAGLGGRGVLIGRDLLGGAFVYDPFELYRSGLLTNPNMIVFGQIGRGKSAFVKSYLWRQAVFGRRAWVVDPKGEYGLLARAWGIEPVALRPGGHIRLNPLDAPSPRSGSPADDTVRRRAELLVSLAAASLGRSLAPTERTAVELAVAEVSDDAVRRSERGDAPTLPEVVDALLTPSERSARAVRTTVDALTADSRQVALELRRLVAGDLQGMFDGPTSNDISLSGPLVVLDLSAVYHSAALGMIMTCATAWLQAGLAGSATIDSGVIVVVDEAWAILANLAVARWLQSSWKLSRAWGVSNIAVLHRLSDLTSAGAAGSEQVGLAQGLLSDSETRVIYAQSPGEVEQAGDLLGLSSTEAELVPHLQRGVALWKVGGRSFLVQHRLSALEGTLVDTDARMVGAGMSSAG